MIGEFKQLDLFEVEYEAKVKSKYQNIKNKLSNYSIDKIYENEFKGQWATFSSIKNRLEKEKDYKEYINDLVIELLKVLPLVEQDLLKKENGIFKYDNGNYGYKIMPYVKDELYYNGIQGPFYCLDMIPKALLGVD